MLLLASVAPLDLTETAAEGLAAASAQWALLGVLNQEDIWAARLLDTRGSKRFAGSAPASTDFHNLFQSRSPHALRHALGMAGAARLLESFDPLLELPEEEDKLYLVRHLIRHRRVDRAKRLADALRDPVERHTAAGLVQWAQGQRQLAERSFLAALQLDPTFEGALYGLLLMRGDVPGENETSFSPLLEKDPAAAVIEGWRLLAAGDEKGARRLEERLAGVHPRHPLFPAATRQRARWRVAAGQSSLAREAIDLLEPLLVPPQPTDLLLRARAAAVSMQPEIVLASLNEAMAAFSRRPSLGRQARELLESLRYEDEQTENWRRRLLARLDAPRRNPRELAR